ncbi:MAG: geranyl transferase [Candidatus Dactylopiibacterium carminicum]|uniref:Geranyl transferase n=1 Tax=Candidatus Dactylopiibacterium carminicum TaxID=857335 RepID=A0A272EPI3_9RHOO|nr:farnesyl diphosphate synthase [Candidatus Dactylopiibacterium carminicum]KAF7598315.1 geranyl transferase [Candidatus Dactylopiibacterium carminicum]PAS92017.1 MAG: geranyl transferase [Candidatus Dactylopiibacterium carminicum]PAS95440.1 MAG: geranyl transferase [Candidatus Dactylopiibacterium carminicum]PAS97312.1 MAG: geranyl transferase [Candidatus Dactylopiibacterium carminicum]
MSDISFSDWMRQQQQRAESALERSLPAAGLQPGRLHEAMRYTTLGGGKRVRPLLAYAAGALTGAPSERLDAAACALECIHVYSLVHDDMPCMDDDALRRGKPTVHVQYDEATALLVGDALQTLAFDLLSAPGLFADPARQLRAVHTLARASGSRGMAGGQAIDLASVGLALTREELEVMHLHKTGALIRAAVLLGALAGEIDEPSLQALDHYARAIGLLFQVVDDILDTTADTATLGKTAGKDAAHDKPTYVSILGLSESRLLASELAAQAEASLQELGERAQRLRELAHYIVSRQF